MTVSELPRIEQHLHHEGAAPPAFIRQLAHEKRVDLSGIFKPDGSYKFPDFAHFPSVYEAACEVLYSPEDLRRLMLAVPEESAAIGAVHSETFLSPDFCGGGDLHEWKDDLTAIQDAANGA